MATTVLPRRALRLAEALLTPHGVDRYTELLDPLNVRREVRGQVTAVARQTPDTVTLTLRPSRAWRGFRAGQYVRVAVDIDGVRHQRCFSPAGSQHRADGTLELTVRAGPDGCVSRHLREHAAPGTVLGLSAAAGEFTLPDPRPPRLLLVSGGSGITPVLSMLRTLADEAHRERVTFLHYARDAADVPYRQELRALAARMSGLRVALAYTRAAGGDLRGHFDAAHLDEVAPWYRDAQTYLCGPAGLTGAVRDALGPDAPLHTENFAPPAQVADTGTPTGSVRFSRSAVAAPNSGKPLLQQAEDAGLAPQHGCRMGICHSCTAVKRSGSVRDGRTGAVSAGEDEEIQICVSVPLGDVDVHC